MVGGSAVKGGFMMEVEFELNFEGEADCEHVEL